MLNFSQQVMLQDFEPLVVALFQDNGKTRLQQQIVVAIPDAQVDFNRVGRVTVTHPIWSGHLREA